MHSPHLRTGELWSTSQKAKHLHCLNFPAQKIFSKKKKKRFVASPRLLFIYLCSHLFMSHQWIHFILWAVIQYHYTNFVPITAPALAITSSFDWLPGPYDNILLLQSLPLLALTGISGSPCVFAVQTQSQLGIPFLSPLNNIPPYKQTQFICPFAY